MVDADILDRKSRASLHHIARLLARRPLDAAALEANEDLWNIVTMDLLQAIQPCIDLALHTVAHDALGLPEGPASAFALLARAGVIDRRLSVEMARAAGLRNLIAHRYGDLRHAEVARAVNDGLDTLRAFLAAVTQWGHDANAAGG